MKSVVNGFLNIYQLFSFLEVALKELFSRILSLTCILAKLDLIKTDAFVIVVLNRFI